MSALREHLESFNPPMGGLEGAAAAAIALANAGHWTTTVRVHAQVPAVTAARLIENLRLGDFLAPNLDPWVEL